MSTDRKPRAALPKPRILAAYPLSFNGQYGPSLFQKLRKDMVPVLVIPMPSAASARARAKFEALAWTKAVKHITREILKARRAAFPRILLTQEEAEVALRAAGHRREP